MDLCSASSRFGSGLHELLSEVEGDVSVTGLPLPPAPTLGLLPPRPPLGGRGKQQIPREFLGSQNSGRSKVENMERHDEWKVLGETNFSFSFISCLQFVWPTTGTFPVFP